MTSRPAQPDEKPKVELVGYDRTGAAQVTPVPPGRDTVEIEEQIRAAGGRVLAARLIRGDRTRPPGVTPEQFAQFNDLLASSMQRSVPMLDGIRDLARSMKGRAFKESLRRVSDNLEKGAPLREAFSPESTHFPRLYGHLLEAGAATGNPSQVLLALSRNIRTDAAFRRGIIEALVYPAFLIIVCLAILSSFSTFYFPRLNRLSELVGTTLPAVTSVLASPNGLFNVAAGISAIIILILFWHYGPSQTPTGRRIKEQVLRRLPVVRSFYEAAVWCSAADTLALLVKNEVPLPVALRLVGPASGTDWLAQSLEKLADEIERGRSLPDAARQDKTIPYRVARVFDSAEIGRDLASALTDLAARYRHETEYHALAFVRYLPPALAVVMGLLVLAMAVALVGPMVKFWGAAW